MIKQLYAQQSAKPASGQLHNQLFQSSRSANEPCHEALSCSDRFDRHNEKEGVSGVVSYLEFEVIRVHPLKKHNCDSLISHFSENKVQSLHVCSHLSLSRKLSDLNISPTTVSGNARKSKPRGMIVQCSFEREKGHSAAQGHLSMHRMKDRCARVVSNLVEISMDETLEQAASTCN